VHSGETTKDATTVELTMWDERFSNDDYLFGTEPAAFLQHHVALLEPGLAALVIADGEGRNSVFIAEQGVQVTAMDASAVGLAKARALADKRGVDIDLIEADLLTWDWVPDQYDLVVGIFFQFLPPGERQPVFEGMQRTVRPGGRVLIHGYTPKQIEFGTGGPPDPANLYTDELLRAAFAGMDIERLESYEAEIAEGTGHVGMSALIDLIANKPGAPE